MKRLSALLFILFAVTACRQSTEIDQPGSEKNQLDKIYGLNIPENAKDPRRLNVYVTESLSEELESMTDENGNVELPAVKSFDDAGIVRMRRLFPNAGKFEARTRQEGMHRWYEVLYEEGTAITKAAIGWTSIPGVISIEFNPTIHLVGDPVIVEAEPEAVQTRASSSKLPFNDPRLPSQWHYYNNGTASSSVSGCDINVVPVWKRYTTGDPSVIVGVVDGGIDFKHEDLADNMWLNPEKKGDYRYGYNFVTDSYLVKADDHGTHVAGTIAAVNNNGIGVCGIAGGNAAAGQPGVRLMSCQIFEDEKPSASGAAAIKWSADHGAVISQNSWGIRNQDTTPTSLKHAVDYFIKYAGIDENGIQTGPMKGGIVIFSAGNDSTNVSSNDYDHIFCVASVGADYRRAYYSNFGEWVDIAAPGGDVKKGNQVLSTTPNNTYGLMQGTSMACPHVSGVAALIVSRYGGEGFTPDELIKRLTEGATPIQSFNRGYQIGCGLVNAYKSIAGGGGTPPEMPKDFVVDTQSNNIRFSISVPADADDGVPVSICFYYKPTDFETVTDDVMFAQFYLDEEEVGDCLKGTVSGLEFNSTYYVAAAAMDLSGNVSPLTSHFKVETGGNTDPVIKPGEGSSVVLKPHQTGKLPFEIIEEDGHFYTIELQSPTEGVVLDTLVRENPVVVFSGPDIPSGSYTASLTVTDFYGASTVQEMNYTILENHAPVVVNRFQDFTFDSRAAISQEFNSLDYFKDDDGEELAYSFDIDNESVINMTYHNGTFFLTPMNYGYANVTVTGTDVRKEIASQSFRVLIRDGQSEMDVYPNPVRTNLYIRMGTAADADVRIVSASGATYYNASGHITPFEPMEIDMKSADPGVYSVLVSVGDKQYKHNIVKL